MPIARTGMIQMMENRRERLAGACGRACGLLLSLIGTLLLAWSRTTGPVRVVRNRQ
jgi:hypothetical protein